MNILIVGCGKVGSQLANVLSKMGHDVSIVDPDEERFSNLSDEFAGYTVTGVPIDQDVLRKAGIEGCEALAAVSNDDNMNVMVCQIASEIFHVPKVLARIYDPARGDVFSHFGLHTVCPTNLSVDALYSMLTDRDRIKNVYLDTTTVAFDAAPATEEEIGRRVCDLEKTDDEKEILFGLLHSNGGLELAYTASLTVIKPDDRLLYAKIVD
ncbi:potassium channel family protein [Youxingia wuxianensis]|uniref:TrkA family potassium uptake protein n=1 Tax=Youxingia wuxianensis TaxID=2763678 RepID=A0A926EQ95_9FIRM|nr:TrkA family potassium uptake protein [Youxingia wuxianensis]MBC8586535.1 TrkA family potassium uptake protein [Youxingia wuxianensis]